MTAIRHRAEPLRAAPPVATLARARRVEPATATATATHHFDPAPFRRSLFWGGMWMLLAALATAVTSLALDGPGAGGNYVYWWGPMAYGALRIVLALRDLRVIGRGLTPERSLP